MYFTDWYKHMCKTLQVTGEIAKLEEVFIKQATDNSRVSTLLRNDSIANELFVTEKYKGKNIAKSELFRTTGNKLYSNNSLKDALKSYTKSIMLAENNSKAIALSFANRSAVLFAMNEFGLCELDISLAFENSYPVDLQYKLYERLGKCLHELGEFEKAKENFEACLKSLNDSKLDKNKRNKKAKMLIPLINNCKGRKNERSIDIVENALYKALPPTILEKDRNDIYTCATSALEIHSDKEHGRFGIATRDISAGEIIIVEKPFSSICLPESFETHCYNCLSRFKILFPCRCCSSVGYCSLACEEKCWNDFHKYECKYLDLLIQDDVGLGHLALKMVTQVELEPLVNFHKHTQHEDGLNADGKYNSSDYLCVYSLIGNSDLREHADLFRRSLLAVFLMKILEETQFFNTSSETAAVVATHLLKQIQMLPCNAHEISENELVGSDLVQNELKEIGSAAYPTLSLLNHSCDPSVVRHCYGDICVLRSLKNMKKGTEIVDNYGFLYAVQEKQERQQHLLDQYYFTCHCLACVEDWPLYDDLCDKDPKFICGNCSSILCRDKEVCDECKKQDAEIVLFDKNKYQERFQKAMQDVLNGEEVQENLVILLEYLDLITKKVKLPFLHVNNCQELVKLCYSLSANFAKL